MGIDISVSGVRGVLVAFGLIALAIGLVVLPFFFEGLNIWVPRIFVLFGIFFAWGGITLSLGGSNGHTHERKVINISAIVIAIISLLVVNAQYDGIQAPVGDGVNGTGEVAASGYNLKYDDAFNDNQTDNKWYLSIAENEYYQSKLTISSNALWLYAQIKAFFTQHGGMPPMKYLKTMRLNLMRLL